VALFIPQNTKRLDIPDAPGQWVEIRTALTTGMNSRMLSAAMRLRVSDNGDAQFDAFAYRDAKLKEIIVAWSDPRPMTPANVDDLDPAMADWIVEQFDTLAAPRSDVEKNASSSGSTAGPEPTTPASNPVPGPQNSPTSTNSVGSGTMA